MATHEATVRFEEDDVDVIVHYEAHKASYGARDRYGAQLEPDEPASIEIWKIVRADTGEEIELSTSQMETLECEIGESLGDRETEMADRYEDD
jgi:hypothetical protein